MFVYYLDLALRSFRRNKVLTALMVALIGIGVAATMTTFAALRAVSGDPVPDKSAWLFVPQIDNQGPKNRGADGEPPASLSYTDAMALLHSNLARRRAIAAPVKFAVMPNDAAQMPFTVKGYAITPDFFTMFDVPFRFGGSWASSGNDGDAVVIGSYLNRKLFHGEDSVGRALHLGVSVYRISGVIADWNPQPRFYAGGDVNELADQGEPAQIFVPFARAAAIQGFGTYGSVMCPPDYHGSGWNALITSECDWISAWVELPTASDVRRYGAFLEGYAAQQQSLGRFQWSPNVRLRNLTEWLAHMHAVPQENRIAFLLAVGLQMVCLLNTLGLLLAKFLRRNGEIGARRALGASRRAIAAQFLTESALVGAAGGLFGLALTVIGVSRIGDLFGAKIAHLVHIDAWLVGLTLLVSVAATVLTSLFPVWRVAGVQPGHQLKLN